eukprot:c51981_g1_i1 orf=140-304(+)
MVTNFVLYTSYLDAMSEMSIKTLLSRYCYPLAHEQLWDLNSSFSSLTSFYLCNY